jgi:hypothetical protein
MKTQQIHQKPLIHLPSGTWVRPETISSIRPLQANAGFPDRVIVHYGDLTDVLPFNSYEEAKWFCDQLSAEVNKPA